MQESNVPTKSKECNHTNIKITSKLTGGDNHYSVISLDNNEHKSLIKRHRVSNIFLLNLQFYQKIFNDSFF